MRKHLTMPRVFISDCGEKYVAVHITAINKEGGYTPSGQRELAWIDEVLLIRELQDQR
jgi:hypothetical protein